MPFSMPLHQVVVAGINLSDTTQIVRSATSDLKQPDLQFRSEMKNDFSSFRQEYQNDMVRVEDSLSQCMKDAKAEVMEGQKQLKDHTGLMITTGFERSKVGLATEEKK